MDTRATTEILRSHGDFVRALARALLRDPHAADDVAQDAWIQLWRRDAAVLERPRAWLRRAVRHLAANHRRGAERRLRHEREGAEPREAPATPAAESERSELARRVAEEAYALDEPYRATILARYFEGLDARELARRDGAPLATVRSRERRALELLRERLDRSEGGRERWALALARLFPARIGALASASALVALALALAAAGAWWNARPRAGATAALPATSTETAALVASGSLPAPARQAPAARVELETSAASERSADADAGPLLGRTLDTAGEPLGGVVVRFERDVELARVVSDDDGRFRVDGLASFRSVSAELAGHRFLYASDPARDPLEPWWEMRIVLAPVGALGVTVRDTTGRTLGGVEVGARPLREEAAETLGARPAHEPEWVSALTDASGRASLGDVWSGVRLMLAFSTDAEESVLDGGGGVSLEDPLTSEQRDGLLVFDEAPGRPIVLRAGSALELVAEWEPARVLRGRVIDPAGGPVHADVALSDGGGAAGVGARRLSRATCAADGSFAIPLRAAALREPLELTAHGRGPERSIGRDENAPNTVFVEATSSSRRLSRAQLDSREPIEIELGRESLGTVSGFLEDERGRPRAWADRRLTVLAAGSASLDGPSAQVFSPDGGFLVFGLPPGAVDLLVSRRWSGEPGGEPLFARFDGLAPGSERVRLALPERSAVRLRLPGLPSRARLVVAQHFPRRVESATRQRAARRVVAASPAAWAADRDSGGLLEDRDGSWVLLAGPAPADGQLALGPPGWYRIGAAVGDSPGVATELLWFGAGEHEVAAALPQATGIVRGRILVDGTREFLALEVVDARGAPLDAPSSRDAAPRAHAVRTDGRFVLPPLAVGSYRLRAGVLGELERGTHRREVEIEVAPGENPELEIGW